MPTSTVGNQVSKGEGGFTYIMTLVALVVMGIMAEAASQSAYIELQKDRESQLLFAGMAYYNAIRQFYQTNGYYPRSLNDLVMDPNSVHRVHLRYLYPDPMQLSRNLRDNPGWRIIRSADGGIAGVASNSSKEPLKKANFPLGFDKFEKSTAYSEWEFEYKPNSHQMVLRSN